MDDSYYWVLLIFLTLVLLFGLGSALSDLVNNEREIVRPLARPLPKAGPRAPPVTARVQRMRGASDRDGRGRARSDIDPRIRQRRFDGRAIERASDLLRFPLIHFDWMSRDPQAQKHESNCRVRFGARKPCMRRSRSRAG